MFGRLSGNFDPQIACACVRACVKCILFLGLYLHDSVTYQRNLPYYYPTSDDDDKNDFSSEVGFTPFYPRAD